jgi:hypothetical protein
MDWTLYIMPAATLIAGLASVLAWYSRLRWSEEYKTATEQIIKSKDANIALLHDQVEYWKSLNSKSIYEQFQAMKNALDETVKKFTIEIAERDAKIMELSVSSQQQSEKLTALTAERDEIKKLKEAAEIDLVELAKSNTVNILLADLEKYVSFNMRAQKYTGGAALVPSSLYRISDNEGDK